MNDTQNFHQKPFVNEETRIHTYVLFAIFDSEYGAEITFALGFVNVTNAVDEKKYNANVNLLQSNRAHGILFMM